MLGRDEAPRGDSHWKFRLSAEATCLVNQGGTQQEMVWVDAQQGEWVSRVTVSDSTRNETTEPDS